MYHVRASISSPSLVPHGYSPPGHPFHPTGHVGMSTYVNMTPSISTGGRSYQRTDSYSPHIRIRGFIYVANQTPNPKPAKDMHACRYVYIMRRHMYPHARTDHMYNMHACMHNHVCMNVCMNVAFPLFGRDWKDYGGKDPSMPRRSSLAAR